MTFRTASSSSTSRMVEESAMGWIRLPVASASYYSLEMAASLPPVRRRRRPRRGSIERPVDGRLYRGAFLVLSLPLLLAAFTIRQPAALPAPLLPSTFDAPATIALAANLAGNYPDRRPGTAG